MTVFAAGAGKDFAIIVAVSLIGAIAVNIGPIVAIVVEWLQ